MHLNELRKRYPLRSINVTQKSLVPYLCRSVTYILHYIKSHVQITRKSQIPSSHTIPGLILKRKASQEDWKKKLRVFLTIIALSMWFPVLRYVDCRLRQEHTAYHFRLEVLD